MCSTCAGRAGIVRRTNDIIQKSKASVASNQITAQQNFPPPTGINTHRANQMAYEERLRQQPRKRYR